MLGFRDGSCYQIGRIFGNIPNGLETPHTSFSENYIVIFFGKLPTKALYTGPKSALWIIGLKVNPPFLELFRKFIRFGSVNRPSQRNKIVTVVSGVDISMWCALSIFCIVDGCSDMGKLGHHRDWMSGYGNIRQAISHQLGAISHQLGAISH